LCTHTRITLHTMRPALNVTTQPTFAPLYRRSHSLLTRPLTARLLSVPKCVEDATGNCLGLRVPPERDVIGRSVTVETCGETLLAVVTTATAFTLACHVKCRWRVLTHPQIQMPPYPVLPLPRTHLAPTHGDDTQRHRLALRTRYSRSWGHGCQLELA
jgi:hypothetical protein